MKQKNSNWINWIVLGAVVVLVILFFFFISPTRVPTTANAPVPTSTPSQTLVLPGQYPADFPVELVLFKNISPISGATVVDGQGHTHLVASFSPEASAAQVYNTYNDGLSSLGWKVNNAGFVGTTTETMVFFVSASKGSETLNVTAHSVPHGTTMTLELMQ